MSGGSFWEGRALPSPSSELAQIERPSRYLRGCWDLIWTACRGATLRKLGDSCLEMLGYRRDQQVAERAVSCYERALQAYTADSHPILWARTMRGLSLPMPPAPGRSA